MTCIIAGNCDNGIVFIADRKVMYGNGNVAFREKIFMDYTPCVIASSGDTMSFDDFREKTSELAKKSRGMYDDKQGFKPSPFDSNNVSGIVQKYPNPTSYPIIPYYSYLEGIKQIVREKKQEIERNKYLYEFDVLIATQTDDGLAHMNYLDDNGAMNEIHEPHIIIGSDSAKFYGSMFIKPFYGKNLTMKAFAELSYFTIKYIDRFNLDDTVGLGGGKPLVYTIPHKGEINKASDTFIENCESNTNKILDNFEKYGIQGFLASELK